MRTLVLVAAGAMAMFAQGVRAPLAHFAVTGKPFPDALRQLAVQARWRIVIGFEYVVVANPARIDVTIDNGNINDALAAMCTAAHYTYAEVSPGNGRGAADAGARVSLGNDEPRGAEVRTQHRRVAGEPLRPRRESHSRSARVPPPK